MNIKQFLQQPEIQQLLEEENLDAVYEKLEDLRDIRPRDLTIFFLENDINPLHYMTYIPENFGSRVKITSITIPNNITRMSAYAFSSCTSLTSITIPESVKSIGPYAFSGCWSLTNVKISDGVVHIYGAAFENCARLKSITLPTSIENITIDTFSSCSSLESITIPKNITCIGPYAFYDCKLLTNIKNEGTKAEWKKIQKQQEWKKKSPIKEINCTDGILKFR